MNIRYKFWIQCHHWESLCMSSNDKHKHGHFIIVVLAQNHFVLVYWLIFSVVTCHPYIVKHITWINLRSQYCGFIYLRKKLLLSAITRMHTAAHRVKENMWILTWGITTQVLTCALAMSRLAPCMMRVEMAVWFWARIAQCNAVLPCSLSCIVVHAPNVNRRRVGSRL